MFMSRDLSPLAIRMPTGLHEMVRAAAHRHRRSINAELVHRLEQTFSPDTPLLAHPARLDAPPPQVLRVAEEHPDLYRLAAVWSRLDGETRQAILLLAQRAAD